MKMTYLKYKEILKLLQIDKRTQSVTVEYWCSGEFFYNKLVFMLF